MTRFWFRRLWLALAAALILAPLAVMVAFPEAARVSEEEGRDLAPAPAWPVRLNDWLRLPRATDAWLRDHFGLRGVLVHARAVILHDWLRGGGNGQVLVGRGGRMFLRGEGALPQSAGLLMRERMLADTADLIAQVRTELVGRGIGFLYAVAPNGATIQTDSLPDWARNPGRETEYDRMMGLLRARGVALIDLRPALRAALAGGDVYFRNDSHWNPRGEVFGFNEVVARGGHPGWRLDPATAFGPPETRVGGDLARLLGVAAETRAEEPVSVVPVPPVEDRDSESPGNTPAGTRFFAQWGAVFTPHVATHAVSGHPGPTILILGDSFTEHLFQRLMLRRAGTVMWLHHQRCAFDWTWIDRLRPDEVWWITTERYMPCFNARPAHMPVEARVGDRPPR